MQCKDKVLGNTGCDPAGANVVDFAGFVCVIMFAGVIEEVRIVGDSEECCRRTTVPVIIL